MSQNGPGALFCQRWTVQKAGLGAEQNEDACLTRSLEQGDGPPQLLIAVADGATEAVYSRLWAKKLVESAEPDWPLLSDDELGKQLDQIRREFSPFGSGGEVPWYVRNKYMDQGSQATLLVVSVTGTKAGESYIVRALAVGDCCLIVFKASGEVFSFPMHSSGDFGVKPVLLGNRIPKPDKYDRWETAIEPGDLILAGTDAVSKWALQCLEVQKSRLLFEALFGLLSPATSDFRQAIQEAPAPAASQSSPTEIVENENHSESSQDGEKPAKRQGWFWQLWPWSTDKSEDATGSTATGQPVVDVPVQSTDGQGEPVASVAAEPPAQQAAAGPRPIFERFIERYRAPDSELFMRNDDATLIVCMPVRDVREGQWREALQVIGYLKVAVAERLQTAMSMREISSD
jgi:hypothetical protein